MTFWLMWTGQAASLGRTFSAGKLTRMPCSRRDHARPRTDGHRQASTRNCVPHPMTVIGTSLPIAALQQSGSFPGYSGCTGAEVGTTADDPHARQWSR